MDIILKSELQSTSFYHPEILQKHHCVRFSKTWGDMSPGTRPGDVAQRSTLGYCVPGFDPQYRKKKHSMNASWATIVVPRDLGILDLTWWLASRAPWVRALSLCQLWSGYWGPEVSNSYFHNKDEILQLTFIVINEAVLGQMAKGIQCLPFHKELQVPQPF